MATDRYELVEDEAFEGNVPLVDNKVGWIIAYIDQDSLGEARELVRLANIAWHFTQAENK